MPQGKDTQTVVLEARQLDVWTVLAAWEDGEYLRVVWPARPCSLGCDIIVEEMFRVRERVVQRGRVALELQVPAAYSATAAGPFMRPSVEEKTYEVRGQFYDRRRGR